MSPKQKSFCELYVSCGNATMAAEKAGYSKRTAKVIGAENLTKPYLAAYITELQEQIASRNIMSARERQELLTEFARDDEQDIKDRIKAVDTLNKMTGEYISKVEVSGLDQEKAKLDSIIQQLCGDG